MFSGSSEAALFFPWVEEFLIPPFPTDSFKEAVAPLSPSSFSSKGTISSLLVNMGFGEVSGRGAGHLINFSFATHSCFKDNSFKGDVVMNEQVVCPETGLLT